MKAVKVIAVILTFIFFGGCFVIGSQKEEAAYEAQLEQQEKDLQQARMARVRTEDIRDTAKN